MFVFKSMLGNARFFYSLQPILISLIFVIKLSIHITGFDKKPRNKYCLILALTLKRTT